MTRRTVEEMRSSRRHIQSVIDRQMKIVGRQHNRKRDRLSSRGVAKLQVAPNVGQMKVPVAIVDRNQKILV